MTRPFPVRLAVTLWAVLLVAVTVRVGVQSPHRASVVPIYALAGDKWRERADLYAPTGLDVFRYPPGFAAAFGQLAGLPAKPVAAGWRLVGAGVLLLGLWRFARAAGLAPAAAGWMAAVAAVLSIPAVNNGQVNVLLAGAVLHATADAVAGRRWRAAGWFALGGWLKVYPLAAGLLAVLVRPRLLGPLVVVTAGGFVAPFLLADPNYMAGQYRRFAESVTADDRTDDPPDRVPRDWTVLPRTFLRRPVTAPESFAASLLAAAGCVGLTLWRRSLPAAAALGCGWMTAFGPATEGNTYAVLAGAAGWACVAAPWRGPAWLGTGLLMSAVFRGAVPAVGDFELLGVQPVGAGLVMLAAAAGGGVHRRRTQSAPRPAEFTPVPRPEG